MVKISEKELEALFHAKDFADFKWIRPEDINICQWVLFKCMYGCGSYGTRACCPPNNPPPAQTREFISEYSRIAIFRFEKKVAENEDYQEWAHEVRLRLMELEREVFLTGYYKAFLLPFGSCRYCGECTRERAQCKNKKNARPCPEGIGIDVFASARSGGYDIQVLKGFSESMNRFAFLLVE